VDLYGNPSGIQALIELAGEQSIFVVEDAAHAIEAIEDGNKIGNRANITCFSLYANKNLTTGEGGMITTESEKIFDKLRLYCGSGISLDAWSKHSHKLSSRRVAIVPGFKYNMFDVQAALGIHQLPLLEQNWTFRHEKYALYEDLLDDIPNISLIKHDVSPNSKHAHHLVVIALELEKLNFTQLEFISLLKKKGISTGIHYYPIHLHPFYSKYNAKLPITEFFAERLVSLPFFPNIHENEIEYVVRTIKSIV
jgi:dTDP-4-amino-4,6-dideoxygalactose transaminase